MPQSAAPSTPTPATTTAAAAATVTSALIAPTKGALTAPRPLTRCLALSLAKGARGTVLTIEGSRRCGRRLTRLRGGEFAIADSIVGRCFAGVFGGRCGRRRRLLGGRLFAGGRSEHGAALLFHFFDLALYRGDDMVVVFEIFEEVADIEESVAIEANIDKGR